MKIGILVNEIARLQPKQTTIRLAQALTERGHEVWMMGLGDLALAPDDVVRARARRTPRQAYRSLEVFLDELRGEEAVRKQVRVDDLDVVLMRLNPAKDKARPWAQSAGIHFARLAVRAGVIVLNDPEGLARANTKLYLQQFPEEVRPRTLVTRNGAAVRRFAEELGGPVVLKPMLGTGGASVFLVRPEDHSNLNQIIEVISKDDFIICQDYLPAAEEGDTRLLMMNGHPLRYRGHYAAVRRLRTGTDLRSNVAVGGQPAPAQVDEGVLRIAEMVRPRLVADGIFLAGLDIIGDKIVEINVFSPGGLDDASRFEKVNFVHRIIEAIEQKVEYMKFYRRSFDNLTLATL